MRIQIMRILLPLFLLSPFSGLAQEATGPWLPPNALEDQAQPDQAQADQTQSTIAVPEGTRVQAALANPIRVSAAHVGGMVRAVTTFPVTVGKDVAIPQGAFLEGSIVKVGKRGSTPFDGLQIEFRQLVFANGYSVALDGSVAEAKALEPAAIPGRAAGTLGLMASAMPQASTPPPLPQVGPPKGPIIAATLGGTVALLVVGLILAHQHIHDQGRDFDTGYQFEIVLRAPLELDSARVAAALGAASGR